MRAWALGWTLGLLSIAVLARPAMAFIPRSGNTVVVSQAVHDDLYLAGGTVMTTAVVDGDVVAAGGTVDLAGGATGGVLAAGGTLTVGGAIGRSVRAAGGTVTLDAQIMGDAVVAGGVVRVPSAARIGRDLVVGAGTINVTGMVGRNAVIGGGDVVIGGAIHGDAEIHASRIVLLPTARIGGALRYAADQPIEVQPGARVAGVTTQLPRSPRPRRMVESPLSPRFAFFRGLAELIALLVLGFVTFAVTPRGAGAVIREVRERFWRSLAIGFVLLVSVPAAALLLMFSVVAIPLSVIAMLLYFATLYPGQLFVAAWLGQAILTRIGRERPPSGHWSLVIGALALVIVFAIPVAGWVIRLLAVCAGFGALWVILWAGVTSRPVPSGA
jgi:hypothetical protein